MNGRVVNSERPGHTILEGKSRVYRGYFITQFILSFCPVPNPLGVLGVLSAFNFPVAVYGWYGRFASVFTEWTRENVLGISRSRWQRAMRLFGSRRPALRCALSR
jgi:hypothetical protein